MDDVFEMRAISFLPRKTMQLYFPPPPDKIDVCILFGELNAPLTSPSSFICEYNDFANFKEYFFVNGLYSQIPDFLSINNVPCAVMEKSTSTLLRSISSVSCVLMFKTIILPEIFLFVVIAFMYIKFDEVFAISGVPLPF